jgi:hypothetical protein
MAATASVVLYPHISKKPDVCGGRDDSRPLTRADHRWLREWRPFPGVIFWRQEPRQERSTLGEVVEAIEVLAEQENPFAYPIVNLRPGK